MTLAEFSKDVVPLIQAFFAGIGLISLFLLWKQLRQFHEWNKLKSCQDFFNNTKLSEREESMHRLFKKHGMLVNADNPLNEKQINVITRDDHFDLYSSIISYIDEHEWFCTALLRGVIDEDYAFEALSTQTIRAYKTLEEFILYRQHAMKSNDPYKNFQTVVKKWKEKTKNIQDHLVEYRSPKRFEF